MLNRDTIRQELKTSAATIQKNQIYKTFLVKIIHIFCRLKYRIPNSLYVILNSMINIYQYVRISKQYKN